MLPAVCQRFDWFARPMNSHDHHRRTEIPFHRCSAGGKHDTIALGWSLRDHRQLCQRSISFSVPDQSKRSTAYAIQSAFCRVVWMQWSGAIFGSSRQRNEHKNESPYTYFQTLLPLLIGKYRRSYCIESVEASCPRRIYPQYSVPRDSEFCPVAR